MELNRKELKKISHNFNSISNRIMRVDYTEYNMILRKFLDYIEENRIIMDYLDLGNQNTYDAAADWKLVMNEEGYMFDFGPSVEEESYQIYAVLKYIVANVKDPSHSFWRIYGESKWQDNVKEFNDRVVLVLINNVNDYLTGIGIDMGLDENVVWNVNGGQVNYARDNATINAVQHNGVQIDELEKLVKSITDNLVGLDKGDADTIIDSVEMISEELVKPEPKGKIISNGIKLLAPMIAIVNGIPTLANNIQRFINFAQTYIR